MKVLVFAVLLVGVSASILPQEQVDIDVKSIDSKNARFVDDLISAALEDISQEIRDAGLDPFEFEGIDGDFALPVPVLFSIDAALRNLRVTGISNIVINSINFGLLAQRLTLDVSLPEIAISIGDASFDITLLGNNYAGRTISRLSIIQPRVWGTIQVNVLGVITGPLIRSIDLEFELQDIQYDGFMMFQGLDYAPIFRNFVSVTIPEALRNMKTEIDELVEIIAWEVVERMLETIL